MTDNSFKILFSINSVFEMNSIAIFEKHYAGRRKQLKKEILMTALQLFNQNGIEATTIEQIRENSDTSVGAIYYHFGTKEGIIANLYFLALDDQSLEREKYFKNINNIKDFIFALVYSYLDWIEQNVELARFQMTVRHYVSNSIYEHELNEKNKLRNKAIFQHLQSLYPLEELKKLQLNLIISLIMGPAEHYAKPWLLEKISDQPSKYRDEFALSAWLAVERFFIINQ
ncbi:TetR/AcrR family transcriptional regulator [Acinetobacter radioresistens]|uniref:TetR/AcrR family transcriptional regulator n=1 Tax=Acinetobacter radioresistens TaxID=40216 RepID=UPI000307C3D9|nr:TetR/AcrR family transcriptional regulator [Acinetobacter radioresistens]